MGFHMLRFTGIPHATVNIRYPALKKASSCRYNQSRRPGCDQLQRLRSIKRQGCGEGSNAWRSTRIRIENILMKERGQNTSANWDKTNRMSRETLELIGP